MNTTVTVPETRTEAVLLGGRYRLDRRVGETGRVATWRATDELLRRPVAIHVLPAWAAIPAGLPEAIQAAARVSDTRLATVYDACYDVDCPYVVCEWAGDPSLEELLCTGLPSPAQAALIVAEAAAAIAAAHRGGRPHLRLEPRCVHWGRSGMKISGLGIDAALSGAAATTSAALDAYALAGILYTLLTGCRPDGDVAGAQLPEPARVRGGVPPVLNAITCHALPGMPGWTHSIRTPAELASALRSSLSCGRARRP
jgi:hypothetical protein